MGEVCCVSDHGHQHQENLDVVDPSINPVALQPACIGNEARRATAAGLGSRVLGDDPISGVPATKRSGAFQVL
jgi:hypothetical protein